MDYKLAKRLQEVYGADVMSLDGNTQYLGFMSYASGEPNKDQPMRKIRRVVTNGNDIFVDAPFNPTRGQFNEFYNLKRSERATLASNPELVWLPDTNYF